MAPPDRAPDPPGSGSTDLFSPEPKAERADAVRNRRLVLGAAAELFSHRDPRDVSMDEVARAAGVGRATLYRRYPNVRSIAVALLDEHEKELQHELISGVPPLGPGVTPAERLAAFYDAMTTLLERFLFLLLGAETGQARYETGAYDFWRTHVRTLLAEAEVPDASPRADLLLAVIDPEFYRYQRGALSRDEISAQLSWLAHQTLRP